MKKTILFGGSGFLGHIFLREYSDIISVGRNHPSQSGSEIKNTHIYMPDMDSLHLLDDVEFENVIFLIGNSNHHEINSSCMMGMDYNVIPLKKILNYLKGRKIEKFVCFTSILLYGNEPKGRPVNEQDEIFPYQNEYIFSKYLAEQVVEFYKKDIPIINIRLCNIYGDTSLIRPDLVPTLIKDVLTKENPTVWNMKPKRDFIFTTDAAEAIVKLLDTDYTGTINLGSGKMSSIEDIANIIEGISGKKIKSLDKNVDGVMEFVADVSLLKSLTGWEPKHSLKDGFEKTYNTMKENLKNIIMNKTLSIYGSHDASVTFIDKNNQLRVYEYERYVKKRFAMFSSRFDSRPGMGSNDSERSSFLELVKNNLIDQDINLILYSELDDNDINFIKKYFPNAVFEKVGHHFSHACSGFYPSGFDSALIFSVDGGGVDNDSVSTTKVYIGESSIIKELPCEKLDFGNPYSAVGFPISEIQPGSEGPGTINSLVYAGKIMGLCAYGKVVEDWKEPFYKYYSHNNLRILCEELSIPFDFNSVSGETSYNLAATSQYTFEKKMDELIIPLIDKYNSNVVLVGGCALNVLYNQRLYELLEKRGLRLYVPPNPNDCGQSYGMFLSRFPELGKNNVVYSGLEILDNDISTYLDKYESEEYTTKRLAELLRNGNIVGILDGNSEVGPRALGNRSIICDPSFPDMKDILNMKVKFREWYRPFAPVCRLEDAHLYFENSCESNYMSYAPKVKPEFEKKLSSIVHVDNTTRLQTTTKEQHSMFYDILSEMSNTGVPVILNTSFNINGYPILSTLEDAFYVLDNTQINYILTNNRIFKKK